MQTKVGLCRLHVYQNHTMAPALQVSSGFARRSLCGPQLVKCTLRTHTFLAPICLQEELRARVLVRFGTFVKDAVSKGVAENDATREAQTLACIFLHASMIMASFVWQAFIRYGLRLAEWPGFAQTLLEAGFRRVSCTFGPF